MNWQRTLVNRPALGVYPGGDWVQELKDSVLSVIIHFYAPLTQVSESELK